MSETDRLWAAIDLLTDTVFDLWSAELARVKDEKELAPLRRCLERLRPLSEMIVAPRSATDLQDLEQQVAEIAETLEEQERDRDRPVHVTIRKNGAENETSASD